jgi:lipoprotein NlpI
MPHVNPSRGHWHRASVFAALRHLALVERGQCYFAEGKRAMARKDFQKVLAENANYPGLADQLMAVGG